MGDPELPEGEKKRRHARTLFGIFEDLFKWFFGDRDEHMEQGRYHVCLRCLLVVCGTLAVFAILFGAGSAFAGTTDYVKAFLDNARKDEAWIPFFAGVLGFDIVIGWTKRLGTPLGHFIRGVAAPFVLIVLILVLAAIAMMLFRLLRYSIEGFSWS